MVDALALTSESILPLLAITVHNVFCCFDIWYRAWNQGSEMPQLRYLSPSEDDDWDASPSPEPSADSAPAVNHDTHQAEVSPSPVTEQAVSKLNPSTTQVALTSNQQLMEDHNFLRASIAVGEHGSKPNSAAEDTCEPVPTRPHGNYTDDRSTNLRATKRMKTEIIDLESDPEMAAPDNEEDPPAPSPSSSSRLLNSFMSNVPRVRKDEWSDDSSDQGGSGQEEGEFQLYHKQARTVSDTIAALDSVQYLQTGNAISRPPSDRALAGVQSKATANVSRGHEPNSSTRTDKNQSEQRRRRDRVGYRFPKTRRKDLQNYIFLATCMKHIKTPVKLDMDAVANELVCSTATVGTKLRNLKKKMDQEGADFGHPGIMKDTEL